MKMQKLAASFLGLFIAAVLSLFAGGMAFAGLMHRLQATAAVRLDILPELWHPAEDAPAAAVFALLVSSAVFLIAQRLFFRPRKPAFRCLSSLLTAWGFTLLLPTLTAWTDAQQGIGGPGHIPLTLLSGFLALLLMGLEALFAVLLCPERKAGR